jgi:hypothetical protein
LRKTGGAWKIVDSHESAPVHKDRRAKAAIDLKP